MRINLDPYLVLMLDMNGTFMFGQDRFGPEQDYFATYIKLGGQSLSKQDVTRAVSACVKQIGKLYVDPDWFDRFPTVTDILGSSRLNLGLNDSETALLGQVIAAHERGVISSGMTKTLHQLSQTHRLILVSNIWSQKDIWVEYLTGAGVLGCFEATVFSSDHDCIKPGQRIYEIALEQAQVPVDKIVFIGDNPECDIQAPGALGMATIQVGRARADISQDADWVVGSLSDLA